MSKIYKGTLGLIGNTPLVEVANIEKELGLEATILVKLEYFNPAGSVKDRIARAMLDDAEAKGLVGPGSVIIEPTSGNTGRYTYPARLLSIELRIAYHQKPTMSIGKWKKVL